MDRNTRIKAFPCLVSIIFIIDAIPVNQDYHNRIDVFKVRNEVS